MKHQKQQKAFILLADGTIFYGKSIGNRTGSVFGEVCFNTAMTGHQEIFTDPSNYGQIIVATHVHIGNSGIANDDIESEGAKIAGLVVRNFSSFFSRPAAEGSLEEFLNKNQLMALTDIDTRALTAYLRKIGSINGVISTETDRIEALKTELAKQPKMKGRELASKVSAKTPYYYGDEKSAFKVAVLDLGIKKNVLRRMAERNCYMKVFPFDSSYEDLMSFNPDGILISNGPGDPEPLSGPREVVSKIVDNGIPMFGIGLGHEILALSQGISTYKMHSGHHGLNHPVLNTETGKGEITAQNHGFAINKEETETSLNVEITHFHLNDHSVSGIRIKDKPVFSVQFNPEAGPGPHDSFYLFDQFISNMESNL